MDAVALSPPPAPFLDDDFDFGGFTFASATAPTLPLPDPQPATFAAFDEDWGDFVACPLGSNWDPFPPSLFGADDQEEEEGPATPPPTTKAHQRAPSFTSSGSRPADLKDLIGHLWPLRISAASVSDAGVPVEAEDDDFGDMTAGNSRR